MARRASVEVHVDSGITRVGPLGSLFEVSSSEFSGGSLVWAEDFSIDLLELKPLIVGPSWVEGVVVRAMRIWIWEGIDCVVAALDVPWEVPWDPSSHKRVWGLIPWGYLVVQRWQAVGPSQEGLDSCAQPVGDCWVVGVWVGASILPTAPWVGFSPYIPVLFIGHHCVGVINADEEFNKEVGEVVKEYFVFFEDEDVVINESDYLRACSSLGLGERGQDWLGVEKVIGDIVKRKCADDTKEAEKGKDCGAEERGKDDGSNRSRVQVVGLFDG
ncbi:hypothetical protein ARMGADRAFT_1023274 [Armillaria gallica]|uniref:Uncharacterized protein n=1 Tax=Armillaria gallica TaxID=47427 RepID=A0A2H3EE95_ARMGA|nr:hypothetical protein ARMGADRAFT_1023274 [Armillaria gallica]